MGFFVMLIVALPREKVNAPISDSTICKTAGSA